MRSHTAALAVVLSLFAGAAMAQSGPSATDLRMGLTGQWSGVLEYRDYQSDGLVELPVLTTISTPGDGATLVQQSLFDDGPGRPVWITTVSLDDPAAGLSTSASYRAGGTPELATERVAVAGASGPTDWTLIYTRTGEDDDQPAEMRITQRREGRVLTATKEVRPVGAGEDAWRFRNRTRLTRLGD
jgi:hypothetical protein